MIKINKKQFNDLADNLGVNKDLLILCTISQYCENENMTSYVKIACYCNEYNEELHTLYKVSNSNESKFIVI